MIFRPLNISWGGERGNEDGTITPRPIWAQNSSSNGTNTGTLQVDTEQEVQSSLQPVRDEEKEGQSTPEQSLFVFENIRRDLDRVGYGKETFSNCSDDELNISRLKNKKSLIQF